MQPGEISEIVETPFGLHIIKLEERKEARLLPLDEIREPLRDHIRTENVEAAEKAEKERLKSEAEIQVLIPLNWVTWLVGQQGVGSVLAATLVALPLPAHQVPVVPILAGLQAKGIAQGADAAFLMAGPVTSIPAMAALWATFRPRVVGMYIGIGLVGSAMIGLARLAFS